MIRVLVTDDSALARDVISKCLQSDSEIEVVGTAENGQIAVQKVAELHPDLVTLDIDMPVMNGLEATEEIMAYNPTPILLITASQETTDDYSFRALDKGALEVMDKPQISDLTPGSPVVEDLIRKVKILSQIQVIIHMAGRKKPRDFPKLRRRAKAPTKVIAIACSTGGPNILNDILSALPDGFPGTILIVQHLAEGFSEALIRWLNKRSKLPVMLANPGDLMEPGIVYLAQNNLHLAVRQGGILGYDTSEPVNGFRPSANVLMKSVARIYGKDAIGVVLTGMGADGADGAQAICENGGTTIAQNRGSSLVFGMPKAAIDIGAADHILPADQIPTKLVELVTNRV